VTGYFGTPSQRHLQAVAEAASPEIESTPGLFQAGRMMGCDDPDRLGWDRIEAILARDGMMGFRLVVPDAADRLRARLAERGYALETWDVFLADRARSLEAASLIVSRGLPEGLADLPPPREPTDEPMSAIQQTMATAGVVPFSGSLLSGALGPAVTLAVGNSNGDVVATAHCYRPHNAHSPYYAYAWGGLVAVAAAHRGSGLGRYINARMILAAFGDLDASNIYELIGSSNGASARMVEACGLRVEPMLVCGVATPLGTARFSR